MGQITVYAQSAGNWDEADNWDTVSGGGGTDYTNPQNGGGNTFICVLNGQAIVLNVDVTVDAIQAPASDVGTLTVSGTRVINCGSTNGIVYGHTLTTGMIVVPTGTALEINGQVVNSAAGYAIVTAGTAALTIANAGGTAVSCTSTGRGVQYASSGALTITGGISSSSTGVAIRMDTGAGAASIAGDITITNALGYGLAIYAGTLTLDGRPLVNLTTKGVPLYGPVRTAGGTFVWTGARAIASNEFAMVQGASGTVNFTNLALANSGRFFLVSAGTLTLTGATFTQQTATAEMLVYSSTAVTITGPSLPAANKVDSAEADYGYAGSLLDPALDLSTYVLIANVVNKIYVLTGNDNYVGGEAGNLELPSQTCVLNSQNYGIGGAHINGTLTLPANGTKILTTQADFGIGGDSITPTYVAAAAADVKDGVAFGAGSAETGIYSPGGTFVEGQADQLATDQAEVTAKAAFLDDTQTICTIAGTLDMGLYVLIASVVAPAYVIVGQENYTGGEAGTFAVPAEEDVENLVQYGADGTEFTGSLVAGGGIYVRRPRIYG